MKAITLKRGREKSLLRRHPWIFSGAIARVEGHPRPGETVDILAAEGALLARGAYSPESQITVRVWTFDPQEEVSPELFESRFARSIETRRTLLAEEEPFGVRLVNAESDGLPGIVVDRYGDFLVVQLLTAGAEYWKGAVVEGLSRLVPGASIYERSDVDVRAKEGLAKFAGVLAGRANGPTPMLRIACWRPTGCARSGPTVRRFSSTRPRNSARCSKWRKTRCGP